MGMRGGRTGSREQAGAAGHTHLVRYRRAIPEVRGCSCTHSTYIEELGPQGRIALVLTPPESGASERRNFADAAHLGTEVMGLEIDGDAVRREHRFQGIGDLLADAFLDGKALGKQAHEPGELGNANDVLVRDVSDVGMPMKRERVVLTQTKKVDGSLDHLAQPAIRTAAALRLERGEQFGIDRVSFGYVEHGVQKALRSPIRGWGMQI